MDTTQNKYIHDMQWQVAYSIEGGFYYTARKQLRDLIDYACELGKDDNTTTPQRICIYNTAQKELQDLIDYTCKFKDNNGVTSIRIYNMKRKVINSINFGFYHISWKQLKDLMDYTASTTPAEMTYNGK